MKKRFIVLIIITLVFLCGCSVSVIELDNVDTIIDEVLLSKNKLNNASFKGYSYYIPNTLKIINKNDYNTLLQDEFSNKYYIYIDVVGYYNKTDNTYKVDKNSYYSKKIVNKKDNKEGYLEINEIKGKYFIEAVYNYGKIEVYTKKTYLNSVVTNLSQVLSSLKYNDKVLSTLVGENVLNYREESFNIFTTKKSTTNYLDYIEQYDKTGSDSNKLPDNDKIDISSLD